MREWLSRGCPIQAAEKLDWQGVLYQGVAGVSDPREMKLCCAPSIERFLLDGWETTKANHRQVPVLFISRARVYSRRKLRRISAGL